MPGFLIGTDFSYPLDTSEESNWHKDIFLSLCLKKRNILILFKSFVLIFLSIATMQLNAQALRQPQGPVLLTVTGKIQAPNADRSFLWDLNMLESLPQKSFTTMTPWSKVPIKFSGPLLRDVLRTMQAHGQTLHAQAMNDYAIQIPVQDAELFDVLIAIKKNDNYIPLRQRGPLFVIYPFDSKKELQTIQYYERSIWQLKSLTVQ